MSKQITDSELDDLLGGSVSDDELDRLLAPPTPARSHSVIESKIRMGGAKPQMQAPLSVTPSTIDAPDRGIAFGMEPAPVAKPQRIAKPPESLLDQLNKKKPAVGQVISEAVEVAQEPVSKTFLGKSFSEVVDDILPEPENRARRDPSQTEAEQPLIPTKGTMYDMARRGAKMAAGAADWMQSPEAIGVLLVEAASLGTATPFIVPMLGAQFASQGGKEALAGFEDMRKNGPTPENTERFLTGLLVAEAGLMGPAAIREARLKVRRTIKENKLVTEAKAKSEQAAREWMERKEAQQEAPIVEPEVKEEVTPEILAPEATTPFLPPEKPVEAPAPTPTESPVPVAEPIATPQQPTKRTAIEEHQELRKHPVRGEIGKKPIPGDKEYMQALTEKAEASPPDVQMDYLDKLEDAAAAHDVPEMRPFIDAAGKALLEGDHAGYARQAEVARNTLRNVTEERNLEAQAAKAGITPPEPLDARIQRRAQAQQDRWLKKEEPPKPAKIELKPNPEMDIGAGTYYGIHHPDGMIGSISTYPRGEKAVQISTTSMVPEYKGKHFGSEAYRQLADKVTGEGKELWSDTTVTPEAARLYESLEAHGYKVEKNSKTVLDKDGDLAAGSEPVFKVSKVDARAELKAAKAELAKLEKKEAKETAAAAKAEADAAKLKRTPAEHKIIQDGVDAEIDAWIDQVGHAQEQLKKGESSMTTESNVEGKLIEEGMDAHAKSIHSLGVKEGSPLAKFEESPAELVEVARRGRAGDIKPGTKMEKLYNEIREAFDGVYADAHLESIRDYLTNADEAGVKRVLGDTKLEDADISFDFGENAVKAIESFESQQIQAVKDLMKGAASGETAGMALPVEIIGRLAAIGAAKLLKAGVKGAQGFYKWTKEMREEFKELNLTSTDLQHVWDETQKRIAPLKDTTPAERKRLPDAMIEKLMQTGEIEPAGQLIIALERASTARKALEKAYTEERSKRFSEVSKVMSDQQGEAGHYQTLSKMKGEMAAEYKDFTPLELPQTTRDALYNQIHAYKDFMPGERLAAADGLRHVFEGRVPKASQLKLLGEIFGHEFAVDLAQKGRSFWDTVIGLRTVGLLTGVKTHLRNMGGSAAFQLIEEVARIPAATIDMVQSLYTGKRTTGGASFSAVRSAVTEARTKGWAKAKDIMKKGATPDELGVVDMVSELKTGIPWLDRYGNFVVRAMAAEDRIFKSAAFRRSLEEQASIRSKNTGESVLEILRKPTDEMLQRAVQDAEFATFNNPNILAEGLKSAQWRMRKGSTGKVKGPAGKIAAGAIDLVIPFKNTPANIIARVFDYAGGGFAKSGYHAIKALVEKELKPEQQRAIAQGIGRGMTGAAMITLGYILAEKGKATGTQPTETGLQETYRAAGRIPGAVKAFGRWHQVAPFSPAGNLITIGATLQRESTEQLRDESKRMGNIAAIATRTALEQPMLKGLSDVIEAARNPSAAGERVTSTMIGSFVPTILADSAALFDPYQRDARTDSFLESLYKGFQARTPGWRNLLPQRVDVLGEPITEPTLAPVNPMGSPKAKEDTDPAIQKLIEQQISIGFPRREPGESRETYKLRSQFVGKHIKLAIDGLEFEEGKTAAEKRDVIKETIRRARTIANRTAKQEFPTDEEKREFLREQIQEVGR